MMKLHMVLAFGETRAKAVVSTVSDFCKRSSLVGY